MELRKAKEDRLAELKAQLVTAEGSPTEVYSRIVGYYRSIRNWNAGKREEFGRRREYALPTADRLGASFAGARAAYDPRPASCGQDDPSGPALLAAASDGRPRSYLLFTRRSCPNCPPVWQYLAEGPLEGRIVDVDEAEDFAEAAAYQILATPTVLLFDAGGAELARCYTRAQLQATLAPVAEPELA
jgi:ribonucleoside-triphosphate reductase